MTAIRQRDAARSFEPTTHYADWRERCPLHHEADHDPPFYVLSRFDDIVAVLKQPERWRNADGPGVFFQERGVLGTTDDPDHARHRSVLRASFVPTAINTLEPRLRALTDSLIDAFIDNGSCDFVTAFANPLPALAIAELLGVDAGEREQFRHWSDVAVAALSGGAVDAYTEAKRELEECIQRGMEHRAELLAAGEYVPDDVLTRLTVARDQQTISDDEARHLGYQLLVAGHETTTSLLGLMLYRLLERPSLMDTLRADPALVPTAVEEALRFDSPVHGLFRTNAVACAVHGATLPPRTKLQVAFAAANRDPEHFPEPDEFRLDRDRYQIGRHVAFGWGIHFCIGAPLPRLEARVAFEQILLRLGDIALDGAPQRNDSFVLHGLVSLPIRFTPTRVVPDAKS